MEDNLLRHVKFHVVTKILCTFKATQCTQRAKRPENASSGRLQEVNKIIKLSGPKGGRGRLHFGLLDWRSFMGGGRLIREVVAHGGSTVCVELRQDL